MSETGKRYIFAGHAIGAAAQFHRLDELQNLKHVIPTLGASVLPTTGGLSKSHASNFCFNVDHPRRRSLLSVRKIESTAAGRDLGSRFETETETEIESIGFVEKLRIDLIKVHVLSTRDENKEAPTVTSKGNKIEGVHLGAVEAKITLDEEPLSAAGSMDQLADFYKKQTAEYRPQNSWRFNTDPSATELPAGYNYYTFSLVREIKLTGPEDEKQKITIDGYTIKWEGFGRIIIGETLVKKDDRRLTMVRLAMGSDAGGAASAGEAESNGQLGS